MRGRRRPAQRRRRRRLTRAVDAGERGLKRLGILLSGRGSNFLAIAEAIRRHRLPGAEIAVVLSNQADAGGLQTARELRLAAFAVPSAGRKRAEHDAEMI